MATPFQLTRAFARSLGLRVPVSITSLTQLRSAYSAGSLVAIRAWPTAGRKGRGATVSRLFETARGAGILRDDAVKMAKAARPELSWESGRAEWSSAGAAVRDSERVTQESRTAALPISAHVVGEDTM